MQSTSSNRKSTFPIFTPSMSHLGHRSGLKRTQQGTFHQETNPTSQESRPFLRAVDRLLHTRLMAHVEDPSNPPPTAAFFYGSLMSPKILESQIHRRNLTPRDAILEGYRRHKLKGLPYPAIAEEKKGVVRGTYVDNLTSEDIKKLDRFEGSSYERCTVNVRLVKASAGGGEAVGTSQAGASALPPAAKSTAGGPKALPLPKAGDLEKGTKLAVTYVWRASRDDLLDEEWDFDAFMKAEGRMWAERPGMHEEDDDDDDDDDDERIQ